MYGSRVVYPETMRRVLLGLGLTLSVSASADLYKWVDREGNTVFSDRPHPGAERIKKTEVQTYPAPKLPPLASPQAPAAVQFSGYQTIQIASPAHDEAIRENAGNVTISASLSPALQTVLGHKLVFLLDGGKVSDGGTDTQITLPNVERGTHTARVAVVDAGGKEIASSAPSTFHLLRVHL